MNIFASKAHFDGRLVVESPKVRVSGRHTTRVGLHVKPCKMHFRECLLQSSIFQINLLDVNGQLSPWTQDSLFHILFLDLAVGIVLHDVVGHSLHDDVDVLVRLTVIDSKHLLEDRLDTSSLLELEIKG